MTPLLSKGRWYLYADQRHVWLCSEPNCYWHWYHTFGDRTHVGPLRRIAPWYAPWQTAYWCVQWAMMTLNALQDTTPILAQVAEAVADAKEIERIVETL